MNAPKLIDILDPGETVDAEMYLEFTDDNTDYADAELAAEQALEEFEFDELLDMNEMDMSEAVAILFHSGELGLPAYVEEDDEEDEGVSDQEAEADDV